MYNYLNCTPGSEGDERPARVSPGHLGGRLVRGRVGVGGDDHAVATGVEEARGVAARAEGHVEKGLAGRRGLSTNFNRLEKFY